MTDSMETFEKELDEARQADQEDTVLEEVVEEEKLEEAPVEDPIEEPPKKAAEEAQLDDTPEDDSSEAKRYTMPEHKKFGDHAGKKLTALEMDEAGLIEKFNSFEHSEAHHQKLYQDIKEKWEAKLEQENKELKEQQARDQAPPQLPPEEQIKHNLTQMQTAYLPALKNQAKAGAFEEDFLTMFPDTAVQMEHRFVAGNQAIEILAERVASQQQFIDALLGVVEEASNAEKFTGSIGGLVEADGDRYSVLKDEQVAQKFAGWLRSEENPFSQLPKEKVNDAVLAQAFLGFIDANPELLEAVVAEAEEKVPRNTGGSTGSTVSRTKKPLSDMDAFERAFNEATA